MLMSYYKRSLLDLLVRVQTVRSSPLERRRDCLLIQEDLLRKIVYVEKRIKSLKRETKRSKGLLARKGAVTLNKAEAREAKGGVQRSRQAIDEYKEILYLFKSIGDALAFIYIPKWDIKPMAFKEDAGYVHGKEGLRQELKFLRTVFEVDGALAILNDLTNSLRYGDLTIVSKGFCGPLEVKSGRHTSRREERQRKELEKMHRYLLEDRTEGLYGIPGAAVRSGLLIEEKDHVNELNNLIKAAHEDGFAFSKVEEGLYYYIVDDEHPGGWDLENNGPGGLHLLVKEFEGKQPLFFFVNNNKFATRGRYPYTLSIRDPQALFDFYSGRLHVNVILDVEAMSAKFETHDLKVSFVEDENVTLLITNVNPKVVNDRWDLVVARHFFERLAYEFLSLDWFVEENARRTDISKYTDHELSAVQVVELDRLGDARTLLASDPTMQQTLLPIHMENNQEGGS